MNELPLIIIGAGDHAKVLLDLLLEQGQKIIGIVDADKSLENASVYNIPIIGNDDEILNYNPSEILLVNGMGSVGSLTLRVKIYDFFKSKGYSFATVVHNSAVISKRAVVMEGAQILAGAVINTDTVIGEDTIINTNTSVDHGCIIGKHVHIAPGCVLSGCVTIDNCTHIGTGSTIIQGIEIGGNTLIGAGSLVIRDIPSNVKAFGAPSEIYHTNNKLDIVGGGVKY